MDRTEKKALAERPLSLPAKVFQWVRRRPVVAVLVLLATAATVVLVIALISSLAPAGRSGPLIKHGNPFKDRGMPGGPKRPGPGEAKKANP